MKRLLFIAALLLVASPVSAATLVSYWKADEGTGTTLTDSAGSNSMTTFGGGETWVTPPSTSFSNPNAIRFNGTTDYAQNTSATGIPSLTSAVSIAFWVWFDGTSGTQTMVAISTTSTSAFLTIELRGGNLQASKSGGTAVSAAITAPSTGAWHHVAYTYDTTTDWIYLDGVGTSRTGQTRNSGAATWVFMSTWSNFNTEPLNGRLDDVRIYSGALTAGEVTTLASGGAVPAIGGGASVDAIFFGGGP